MSGTDIMKVSNILDALQVDGVYILEQDPPGSVRGLGTGVVGVVGQFEKGPINTVTQIGSPSELARIFGGFGPASGTGFNGFNAIFGKRFKDLRIVRIDSTGLAFATKSFNATATPVFTITAKYKGAWGNNIKAQILASTDTGITEGFRVKIYYNDELVGDYDDLDAADGSSLSLPENDYVTGAMISAQVTAPDVAAATALVSGSDGTPADVNYTGDGSNVKGIRLFENESDVNILICGLYNDTINTALEAHVSINEDKIAIIAGTSGDTVATAVTDVADYRHDRLVYTYPYIKQFSFTKDDFVTIPAAGVMASILSEFGPNIDPAIIDSVKLTTMIDGLDGGIKNLTYAQYVSLNKAGISALTYNADYGYRFKNGVTTSLVSGKEPILRRRMTDFLQNSIASRLLQYQNKVNKRENHEIIKGEIEAFLGDLGRKGILPTIKDVDKGTLPFLVDIDTLNDNTTIANGEFHILLKVRIFSAMRYIVLKSQVGTGVEVREEQIAA